MYFLQACFRYLKVQILLSLSCDLKYRISLVQYFLLLHEQWQLYLKSILIILISFLEIDVWVLLQFETVVDTIVVPFRYHNICLVFCPRHKPLILNNLIALFFLKAVLRRIFKLYSDFDETWFLTVFWIWKRKSFQKGFERWFFGIRGYLILQPDRPEKYCFENRWLVICFRKKSKDFFV